MALSKKGIISKNVGNLYFILLRFLIRISISILSWNEMDAPLTFSTPCRPRTLDLEKNLKNSLIADEIRKSYNY